MVKEGEEDGEELRLRRRDLKTLMGMCEEEKGQVMGKNAKGAGQRGGGEGGKIVKQRK